jgi:hypothetical protein
MRDLWSEGCLTVSGMVLRVTERGRDSEWPLWALWASKALTMRGLVDMRGLTGCGIV